MLATASIDSEAGNSYDIFRNSFVRKKMKLCYHCSVKCNDNLNYDFVFLVALVAFQQDLFSASEGGMVEVCAVISSVPTGGLECPVVATLSATDGKAGK